MTRKQIKPKDVSFFTAFLELPEAERRVISAYVHCRACVKGCGPDDMTPADLMALLTGETGAKAA